MSRPMTHPRLIDIIHIYDGEFYLCREGEGVGDPMGKIYSTSEIIAGEDSLPEEFLANEITIYPWDSATVVVLILNGENA